MEDRTKITGSGRTLPEALGGYAGEDTARFHMPGHKGRGMCGFWREDILRWDVTELSGTDNLHRPEGAILDAQKAMAAAYGAAASFYIVNGSTAAVQAMILSLPPEEKLLLCRDAHRSAISGAALGNVPVAYLVPPYEEDHDLTGLPTPDLLERRLEETGATAVLLTSPNFYGMCADIPALSAVAHAHGALLLVDGAHGAHFPFSDLLPEGLAGYADLWAHSQHKTMNALTQAASLHLGNCRIPADRVRRILAMIETSSPSYLLMSSLDWSVYMGGRQDWSGQVRRMQALEKRIRAVPGLSVLSKDDVPGAADRDGTRLVIDVTGRGYTGFAAAALLEAAGIFVEMADARRLVLITTPEDDPVWYERLLGGLKGLPEREPVRFPKEEAALSRRVLTGLPERCMTPREAAFANVEPVPLSAAAGRICGGAVGAYPPGIAVTMPGERMTRATVDYLLMMERRGATLFGVDSGRVGLVTEP